MELAKAYRMRGRDLALTGSREKRIVWMSGLWPFGKVVPVRASTTSYVQYKNFSYSGFLRASSRGRVKHIQDTQVRTLSRFNVSHGA
jgi:hypothetical protein